MPVDSQQEANINPAKYILYYSTTFGGSYKRSYRTIIQSFRTQMKGLGGGSAIYLPQSQLNSDIKTENLLPNMFIKILDGTKYWSEEYTSVGDELFIGTIESVTNDIFQGSEDRQGNIIFNEIGHYLATKPIIWNSKPQIFNPVLEGICYGNKSENDNSFESNPSLMATASSDSEFPTTKEDGSKFNNRVWSLEQMLSYMASNFTFNIEFPWTSDNNKIDAEASSKISKLNKNDPQYNNKKNEIENEAANKKEQQQNAYYFFKDSTSIRSYNNYDGQSVPQMLDELLQEPFSYRIVYKSTSAPTYQIINKSPVAITEVCPAAYSQVKTIDNSIIENLNITEDSEVYDSVTYRGDNIIFCGTITPWIQNDANSLVPRWTTSEELVYTYGDDEEPTTSLEKASTVRAELTEVYRGFKFRHYDQDCYFRVIKKVNEQTGQYEEAPFYPTSNDNNHTFVPFFPQVDFVKYENNSVYVLPKPKIYDSLTLHKSPPKLFFRWADKLPFSTYEDKLKEPFVIATCRTPDGSSVDSNSAFFIDMTKPGGGFDTCRINFLRDGLKIEVTIPETLASNDDLLFWVGEDVGAKTGKQPWKPEYVSLRNPSNTNYKWLTSWEATAFTVAAYSDQKLQWTVTNPNSTSIAKTKIIEDDSLQCHIVHAGTIKKLRNGPFELAPDSVGRSATINGFERFQTDTFVRNDFKKLYTLANQCAQWLFQKKRAMRLENHLMLYNSGSWNVGEMIGSIKDEKVSHILNTTVESIEYDATMNRVRISTSIPSMPEFKRLRQQPISAANVSPMKDTKAPTITDAAKTITVATQPTVGQITGGTSEAGVQKIQIIQIIDGNEIDSVDCIKAIAPETSNGNLTIPEEGGVDAATLPLPDGYGRAWLFEYSNPPSNGDGLVSPDNGVSGRVLVQNATLDAYKLPLLAGNSYYVSTTVDISGDAGAIYKAYIPRGL